MYEILIEGIDSEFETVDKEVIEYNAARVAKPDYEQIRKQQQQQQQEQQQQIQAEKEAKKNAKAEKKEKYKKKLEAEKKGENNKQETQKPEQKQNYIQRHTSQLRTKFDVCDLNFFQKILTMYSQVCIHAFKAITPISPTKKPPKPAQFSSPQLIKIILYLFSQASQKHASLTGIFSNCPIECEGLLQLCVWFQI
ncbi:Hypothetical_protein [Hexamita inflata]|uniref:Hypothetical_protein n=1 Tax=Hexamita inflata TaxID=28002 RepID=A0AA86QM58_9EUKA|nr:Hypothetical protein HINF_LOCUS48493 [Hexamita inflata]